MRSVTQDDSHIFCRPDQIEAEVDGVLASAQEMYGVMGMGFRVSLSYRDDSDAYLGDKKLWEQAQKQLKAAVIANKLEYFEQEGEAAFYGPKIDFMVMDAIGREHQLATVQIDFVQPERFKLEYTSEDGTPEQPVMIHCALLGSIERFLSVYIEHTAGKFPIWLAPEQIRLITVNQEETTVQFAQKIVEDGKKLGLRITVDNDNESISKKIRAAELMRVPYVVVIGEKEINGASVMPRIRKDLEVIAAHPELTFETFLNTVVNETKSRVSKSSL